MDSVLGVLEELTMMVKQKLSMAKDLQKEVSKAYQRLLKKKIDDATFNEKKRDYDAFVIMLRNDVSGFKKVYVKAGENAELKKTKIYAKATEQLQDFSKWHENHSVFK